MFDYDEILSKLRDGDSVEDLGNEFAAMLNKANAQFQKEEEENAKKAANKNKINDTAAVLEGIIQYLFDYYPSIGARLMPENEYDLDELAQDVVYALDAYEGLIVSLQGFLKTSVEPKERKVRGGNGSFEDLLKQFIGD